MLKSHRKANFVTQIKSELLDYPFLLLGQYTKINVRQFEVMRNKLRPHAGVLKIYKNNLLKLACLKTSFASFHDHLQGPNFVIKAQGEIFPLFALLQQFKKEFKTLTWKIGVWNGKLLDQTKITLLGQIPDRKVLFQRLLMTLKTPLYQLHATLKSWSEQRRSQSSQNLNQTEKSEEHQ